jgi:hypothetical protein
VTAGGKGTLPSPSAAIPGDPPVDGSSRAASAAPDAAVADAAAADDAAGAAADATAGLRSRFERDPKAAATALDLFARTGDVATLLAEQDMDGGWRGKLHLVPELPVGRYEPHLEWLRAAALDYDGFFASLNAPAGGADARPVPYRWRGIELRFFRSVGGHRPSAFAEGWSIAYNVEGSLNLDANAVRELFFHEIFHLNDAAHGDWSVGALGALYEGLVARCGTRVDCLTPFAPTSTRVRNGTYYAFQPNNGMSVREYAAELSVRYYREQRDAGSGATIRHPFKCGPAENGRAWKLLVDEFFAGRDRTPACM